MAHRADLPILVSADADLHTKAEKAVTWLGPGEAEPVHPARRRHEKRQPRHGGGKARSLAGIRGYVRVVRGRAEDAAKFGLPRSDVTTAWAVAPLLRLAELAMSVIRPGGMVLAIKGINAAEELRDAGPVLRRIGVRSAKVVRAGHGKVVPATTVVRFFAQ